MRPLSSTCVEASGNLSDGFDRQTVRGVAVASHRAGAVFKFGRTLDALAPAIAGGLPAIAGVLQVHVDLLRSTIHVLYDRQLKTVKRIHRRLVDTGWENEGHEQQGG